MGHCLGLFHTFHGLCGEDGCVETTTPETDPDNPCECGDYVADTPADPRIEDQLIDDETCELIILGGCDVPLLNYNPLTDNIMSYAGPTCEQNLTNGQKDRIKHHLLDAPLFAPVLQNCIIPLSQVNQSLTQNWFNEPILAAGITDWTSDNIRILGKITIPAGATLHINNATVEFENQTSGIVVQKGGVLVVENSTLRGNSCNNSVWSGILIEGNAFEPIPSSFYTDGMVFEHHGIARLRNNVVIENAMVGVQAGDYIDFSLPTTHNNNSYGGGALFIEQTNFNNNSIGVFLLPQYAGDQIFVRLSACTFSFSANFPSMHRFPDIGYAGIYTIRPYLVQGCTFQNTNPSLITERGTGIISNRYGGWVIPSFSGTPCRFTGLYKGIDAYATGSLQSGLFVTQNLFEEVNKGITLNGNAVSRISYNHFLRLDKNSYAVYALQTRGIAIHHNYISVSVPPSAYYEKPYGIALYNSGIGGALVVNNTFVADDPTQTNFQRFRAATQVEGNNNPNVLIDCNNFVALSDYDIRIFNSPDFEDQGGCDEFNSDLNPTANNWHNPALAPAGTQHIYYDNAIETINVTCLPGYEPTLVSANVNLLSCANDENDCESFIFAGGALAEQIAYLQNRMNQSVTDKEYEQFYAELIRTYLQNHLLTEAKEETEARNDSEGDKILIATYTDERELEKADSLLQTLPLQTQEDADFYNFFSAYLYELHNNADLMPYEGKALSPAAIQIQNMANQSAFTNKSATFAQSTVAAQQNMAYSRVPSDITPKTEIIERENETIKFMPNPAKDLIQLSVNTKELDGCLYIYSAIGAPVMTISVRDRYTLINTALLSNGVYFCEFASANGTLSIGKFIILR